MADAGRGAIFIMVASLGVRILQFEQALSSKQQTNRGMRGLRFHPSIKLFLIVQ